MKVVVFIAATAVACTAPRQAPNARVPVEDHAPVEGVDVPCTKPATQTPPGEWVDPIGVDRDQKKPEFPAPKDNRVDCSGTAI